jgi:nucleoside-diphosphate-sugar epimerase
MTGLFIAGCGYTGQRLAKVAVAAGWNVTCHLRDDKKAEQLAEQGVSTVVCSMDHLAEIPELPVAGKVLLYSVPPQGGGNIDLRTRNFCLAIERDGTIPGRIVYLSATSVYGDAGGAVVDEQSPVQPLSAMGKRRQDAESIFKDFGERHAIPVVILRVSGIYGPGRLPIMQISQGQPLLREEEARPSNRIHVDDLVQVCMAALNKGEGVYNVSDGSPSSMTTYFNACADLLGYPRQPQVDMDEARRVMPPLLFNYFVESRVVDNSKMLNELGVRLLYPTIAEGLPASR